MIERPNHIPEDIWQEAKRHAAAGVVENGWENAVGAIARAIAQERRRCVDVTIEFASIVEREGAAPTAYQKACAAFTRDIAQALSEGILPTATLLDTLAPDQTKH